MKSEWEDDGEHQAQEQKPQEQIKPPGP